MSSDFHFTVKSWFLGNVHIKPYFNTQPFWFWQNHKPVSSKAILLLGSPLRFSELSPSLNCSIRNAKENIYANVSVGGVWETPNNVVPYIPLKNRARHKYRPVVKFWVGSLAHNHRFFFSFQKVERVVITNMKK